MIAEGLSENEAVGKVISEFGSIDEILEELNLDFSNDKVEKRKSATLDEVKAIEKKYRIHGFLIGFASFIVLILIGIIVGLEQRMNDTTLEIIFMLGIIPSVSLYIYSGMMLHKAGEESNNVFLSTEARNYLKKMDNKNTYAIRIIVGVALCIVGLSIFAIGDKASIRLPNSFGFLAIGLGVNILIYNGITKGFLTKMLSEKNNVITELDDDDSLSEKIISSLFILATIFYVASGFLWDWWSKAWIIFPVMGMISAIISIFSKDDKGK